jgi:hypothetical protein
MSNRRRIGGDGRRQPPRDAYRLSIVITGRWRLAREDGRRTKPLRKQKRRS